MVKILLATVALASIGTAALAQRPRLRPAPNVLFVDQVASAFILPAVASTSGAGGEFFRSEVVLSNFKSVPQRVAVSFLPLQAASPITLTIFELPSYENNGDLGLVAEDFLTARMGVSGLGALVVQGIDANGAADSTAQIDGFARVWTPQPARGGCPNPTGTVSQTMLAVPINHLVGSQFPAFALGLRHDESFRTNVGIVNLSGAEQTWEVEVTGTRGGITFNVRVPGNSLNQVTLPTGTYGNLSVTFTLLTQAGGGEIRWTAYATSVDNRTGDGWVRNATY